MASISGPASSYPPPTAVAFVPLAILPFEAARAIWSAGLLVLAGGLAYRLLRPIAPALRPWALAAYVLYLPLIAEITLGNLNLVTLAVCLLAGTGGGVRSWGARRWRSRSG